MTTLRVLLTTKAGQRRVRDMLDAGTITARQIMEARNAPEDRAILHATRARQPRTRPRVLNGRWIERGAWTADQERDSA